jgi:hypothetical protein
MKQGIILGLDRSGKTMLLHQLVEMTKNYRHISLASKIFSGKNFNKGQTREKSKVEIHSVGVNEDDYTNVSNNFERLGSNGRRSIVMPDFKPTVGVEHTTLSIDTRACTICEVGGQMLPMWKAYYGSCNFWIVSIQSYYFFTVALLFLYIDSMLWILVYQHKSPKLLWNYLTL